MSFNLEYKPDVIDDPIIIHREETKTDQYDGLLIKILSMVGLNQYINNTKHGLNQMIEDNGRNLPLGIKKRIGLARAFINDGKIVILDEPTESLDSKGVKDLYDVLNNLRKLNKTIIIASHNPDIIKSAGIIIDLSSKPIPRIGVRKNKNAR